MRETEKILWLILTLCAGSSKNGWHGSPFLNHDTSGLGRPLTFTSTRIGRPERTCSTPTSRVKEGGS